MLFFVILVLPIFIIISAITEVILYRGWEPSYYKFGINLVKKKTIFPKSHANFILNHELFQKYMNERSGIAFHKLAENTYGFRDSTPMFSTKGYMTPIMHGLIKVKPTERTIIIYGKSNFYPIIFFFIIGILIPVFIYIATGPEPTQLFLFLGSSLFFSLFYYLQKIGITETHAHLRQVIYKQGVINPELKKPKI